MLTRHFDSSHHAITPESSATLPNRVTSEFTIIRPMAGQADLVSFYGQFDTQLRYTDSQARSGAGWDFSINLAETGQLRMGNPPWKDVERYTRNSPVFHADRVHTPLLLIHGDLDGAVPIQQSEEFFTALYRQGKRARFVRYWGEGHNIESSPANLQDMWKQIYAWFDEFLKPDEKKPATQPSENK